MKYPPCLLIVLAFAMQSLAQERPVIKVGNCSTPRNAVSWALDHARKHEDLAPFLRYVWVQVPEANAAKYVSLGINQTVSRSDILRVDYIHPAQDDNPAGMFANGHLIAVDLQALAPKKDDLEELLRLWDGMIVADLGTNGHNRIAVEPYFTILGKLVTVDVEPYTHTDGQRYTKKWVREFLPAPHLDLDEAFELRELTASKLPVVHWQWFLKKISTTVNGGMYYDFLGVVREAKDGKTPQQLTLAKFGIDETKARANDERAAILHSKVTGRERRIDVFRGIGGRNGTGFCSITHDPSQEAVDEADDPFLNLLTFNDAAREILFELPNGLQGALLTNENGEIQNEAPPNVVSDRTVPAPHPTRLHCFISCMRCHGGEREAGYKDFINDVPDLFETLVKPQLDVFDDVGEGKETTRLQRLERLTALYQGDLKNGSMGKRMFRARDDLSDAVFICTGGLSVSEAYTGLCNAVDKYEYDVVTPQAALLEVGYVVPEGLDTKAVQAVFTEVVPILPPDEELGISFEDGRISILRAGKALNRTKFERIYADFGYRAFLAAKARLDSGTSEK